MFCCCSCTRCRHLVGLWALPLRLTWRHRICPRWSGDVLSRDLSASQRHSPVTADPLFWDRWLRRRRRCWCRCRRRLCQSTLLSHREPIWPLAKNFGFSFMWDMIYLRCLHLHLVRLTSLIPSIVWVYFIWQFYIIIIHSFLVNYQFARSFF